MIAIRPPWCGTLVRSGWRWCGNPDGSIAWPSWPFGLVRRGGRSARRGQGPTAHSTLCPVAARATGRLSDRKHQRRAVHVRFRRAPGVRYPPGTYPSPSSLATVLLRTTAGRHPPWSLDSGSPKGPAHRRPSTALGPRTGSLEHADGRRPHLGAAKLSLTALYDARGRDADTFGPTGSAVVRGLDPIRTSWPSGGRVVETAMTCSVHGGHPGEAPRTPPGSGRRWPAMPTVRPPEGRD